MHKLDLVAVFLLISAFVGVPAQILPASTATFAPFPLSHGFGAPFHPIPYATSPARAIGVPVYSPIRSIYNAAPITFAARPALSTVSPFASPLSYWWARAQVLAPSPGLTQTQTMDLCTIKDVRQCPPHGADYYHHISRNQGTNPSKAAEKYGKRVADFLAKHVNAMNEEGDYHFTHARYNFTPSALNHGGCRNGMFGTEPQGAVGTPSDVILQERAMQFRYYNVAMTTDDGEFTLKALEVTNRREEDGLAHMRICRCVVDGREAGKDFCEDLRLSLEHRFEFLECRAKNSVSYCKEKVYGDHPDHHGREDHHWHYLS